MDIKSDPDCYRATDTDMALGDDTMTLGGSTGH